MDDEKLGELKIQLQQLLDEVREFAQRIPPAQLYAAIGIVLFTVFLFTIISLLKHRSANTILLTGLSGSGKTVLFYQLRDGSSHQGSVTSMEPNEGTFVLHSDASKKGKVKPVHLVDVPGHSQLRPKLNKFLSQAAGIVFVLDAVEFLPNLRPASEYLYDILTNASVVKKRTPLLHNRRQLEKEMSDDFILHILPACPIILITVHEKNSSLTCSLRFHISNKLQASRTLLVSADTSEEHTLGVAGEAFAFSQCHHKVITAEASGLTADVSHLEQFIRDCVNP